ncbi:MAG TPA: hypothetical protein DIW47_11930 [Bacteroidetes bacterium]|nr:hypothetical protein [Bacteroidota bacterium]
MRMTAKPYDIFISYVVEDREIVERIVEVLESYGLKVWYAKYELYPGAEIRPLINEGLAQSQYGVAIMSPLYRGPWPHGELFYMLQRQGMLIPVLHEVSLDEVVREHPDIGNRYCLMTDEGIELAGKNIAEHIKEKKRRNPVWKTILCGKTAKGKINRFAAVGIIVFITAYFLLPFRSYEQPPISLLEEQIAIRKAAIEHQALLEFQKDSMRYDGFPGTLVEVVKTEEAYLNKAKGQRNFIEYFTGKEHIRTFVALEKLGVIEDKNNVEVPFGLSSYTLSIFKTLPNKPEAYGYSLFNILPLNHEVKAIRSSEGHYEVDIHYANYLRYTVITLEIDTQNKRIRNLDFIGLKPFETFVFKKQGNNWDLVELR